MARANTETLQRYIDRLAAGDDSSRQLLVDQAYERLRLLARKLLAGYPGVRRWEQTDDVLQRASIRLWKALEDVQPTDVRGFFGLAATQMRRELIDLARHYYGAQGLGKKHATNVAEDRKNLEIGDPTAGPLSLSEWTELHEQVQQLPEEQREIFDLLYYHGLTQPEAAEVLGMPLRTLKRRWRDTKRAIYAAMHGEQPGESQNEP